MRPPSTGGRVPIVAAASAAARDHATRLLTGGHGRPSLASALVVTGHAVTFLIAARTAGATAPPSETRWRCS
jgi:hypothetical protein